MWPLALSQIQRGYAHNGSVASQNRAEFCKAAVIVDPYSSGKYLLYELKERDIEIICVRSSLKCGANLLKAYDSHRNYFVETIDYENLQSLQQLVDQICALPYNVIAVFGGSEPGVELAERLAEAMHMPTANGTELLHARKDKAAMQDQLRLCGLPAAEQFKSGELNELLDWARARNQWPLVAKPTGGSGSDGVFLCKTEADLITAHTEIIGALNPHGITNSDIALQEFLVGDEYIVDTVSHEGKHLCVAVWVYKKKHGLPWNPTAIMNCQNKLLAADGEKQDELVAYVSQVLDAVGLRFGPCHTEVMFTARGPILIEVNARLHGLQGPRLIELSTGTSKAAYAADAILGGGNLFNECYVAPPKRFLYPMKKQCVQLVLICPVRGYLKTPIQDVINKMQLESVVEVLPAVQKGQYVQQTCDLPTSAGQVLMVNESGEQIAADIARIRAAEESGELYQVSQKPLPSSPKPSPVASPLASPRLQSVEKGENWFVDDELSTEDSTPGEIHIVGLD